jgi:hypothetical protein
MPEALKQLTIETNSAAEFLDYIRPSKNHWQTGIRGKLRWIFRGQQDSTWGLTPSAWRKDEKTKAEMRLLSVIGRDRLVDYSFLLDRCRLYVPDRVSDANEQSESELRMLQEFVAHVNVGGLNFPHDTVQIDFADMGFVAAAQDFDADGYLNFKVRKSPFFDRALQTQKLAISDTLLGNDDTLKRLCNRWPYLTNFTMRHSIAALAQHHGIPTRLLDWSYDARKAAYFACRGIHNDDRSRMDKHIALFAINPFMLKNRFLYEESLLPQITDDLSVEVFLSRHSVFTEKNQTTSFIAAQEGLFTYPEHADLYYLFTGSYPDILTTILRKHEWETKYQLGEGVAFPVTDYIRKITLPYSQVDALLEMLDDERVILTTLMPALDRMKECMMERSSRKIRLEQH